MTCNHDCLNCTYEDCVNDKITDSEIEEINQRNLNPSLERHRIANRKYFKTDKGRAARHKYNTSDKKREANLRYQRKKKAERERVVLCS